MTTVVESYIQNRAYSESYMAYSETPSVTSYFKKVNIQPPEKIVRSSGYSYLTVFEGTSCGSDVENLISEAQLLLNVDQYEYSSDVVGARALQTACDFIRSVVKVNFLDLPFINPGPDNSVDLYWTNDKFNLLINFSNKSDHATFHGENVYESEIFGEFAEHDVQYTIDLIEWLNQ